MVNVPCQIFDPEQAVGGRNIRFSNGRNFSAVFVNAAKTGALMAKC